MILKVTKIIFIKKKFLLVTINFIIVWKLIFYIFFIMEKKMLVNLEEYFYIQNKFLKIMGHLQKKDLMQQKNTFMLYFIHARYNKNINNE